uniref:Uncharacterized protein n=1 Tax=Pinguiococcus pyrenoidosus TaxID=172671 RepID=A0A7R9UF24_9STRA
MRAERRLRRRLKGPKDLILEPIWEMVAPRFLDGETLPASSSRHSGSFARTRKTMEVEGCRGDLHTERGRARSVHVEDSAKGKIEAGAGVGLGLLRPEHIAG